MSSKSNHALKVARIWMYRLDKSCVLSSQDWVLSFAASSVLLAKVIRNVTKSSDVCLLKKCYRSIAKAIM